MKNILLSFAFLCVLPLNGVMHQEKMVDVQPLIKRLQTYEQLTAQEMIDQTDAITDLIAELKDARKHGKSAKQANDAIKHYLDVQKKKLSEALK